MGRWQKAIFFLFGILFFATPLIFWPFTSEVFELNKIVFVYAVTVLIVSAWLARTDLAQKIIFRRTLLDIPLLVFIASQILSTIFSVDPQTSLFGYYSRWNGGLLSTLTYSFLYWAYVSNVDSKSVIKHIYILLASSLIAGGMAILEHFGVFLTCGAVGNITANCWVQDVQLRVFSTFGQPNWLAMWIVALMPLVWSISISKIKDEKSNIQFKNIKFWVYYLISVLFFITLLFTKSRSGILGFILASLIFWPGYIYLQLKSGYKLFNFLFVILIFNVSFLILFFTIDNPFRLSNAQEQTIVNAPALEIGGTESGEIRKIVWKGALGVWKKYPIFGSGLETFAYSYYGSRPAGHNLVSEWDFIYNKAHNEYLNYAANSGTIGLISYLALIIFSVIQISKSEFLISKQIPNFKLGNFKNYLGQLEQLEISNLRIALTAGYVSILVTNFFGFSVVPTQLLFFLFPAFAIALVEGSKQNVESKKLISSQKILIATILLATYYLLLSVAKFWSSDINYAKGKNYNASGNFNDAIKHLTSALTHSPNEPIYHNELAQSYVLAGVDAKTNEKTEDMQKYAELAVSETKKAVLLSPANVNLKRSQFGVYIRLSTLNPQFLAMAKDTLVEAIKLAPTDAKLIYNLGLTEARLGDVESALANMEKAINLKSNYKDARLAHALLLIDKREYQKAREDLNYILEKIDPNDAIAKTTLEEIGNQ